MIAIIRSLQKRARELAGAPNTLRGRVTRSASWVSVGYVAEMVLRLGSSLILTRLLSPAAFGIMATAQVFLFTVVMLSDVGIRSLVITFDRSDDPAFLRTVWTFQIIRGVVLASFVAILGQALSAVQWLGWLSPENSFAETMLPAIIGVMGITLAFEGLKSINENLMARDLRQDVLVKLEMTTRALSTFITVAAVWVTRSIWGFVFAALIVAMVRATLSNIFVPGERMQIAWHREYVRYVVSRGKWIGLSSWTTLASSLADKVLIGSFFGSSVLGIYTLAQTIANAIFSIMDQAARAISLPIIHELMSKDKGEFNSKFFRIRNTFVIGSSAVGLLTSILSNELVYFFYDTRYAGAAPILAVLSLAYLISPFNMNINVMQAVGSFAKIASFNVIRTVVLWISVAYFASTGRFEVTALAIATSPCIEAILSSIWLVRNGFSYYKREAIVFILVILFIFIILYIQ